MQHERPVLVQRRHARALSLDTGEPHRGPGRVAGELRPAGALRLSRHLPRAGHRDGRGLGRALVSENAGRAGVGLGQVKQGTNAVAFDENAPVVTLKYPTEGTKIQVPELITSINIQFEVTDDIELDSISVIMDGTKLIGYRGFKDYRRAVKEYLYDHLTNGVHVLIIKATDLTGKVTNKTINFEKKPPYTPVFAGEIFYMPFDGDYMERISFQTATKVGNPGLTDGRTGQAYAGATGAYLTYPTTGLTGSEFSAAFWYKLNATPDRAGILVIGPPDATAPTAMNNRNAGFRFFRESSSGKQRFKLNVGSGSADSWFDGGTAADVDPATTTGWIHLAFTISATRCAVYINGQVVSQGSFTGVDWTGCDILSIMSGAPRFTGWDHLSDNSLMDDLRLFNRALTQTEITNMYNGQ